MSTEPTDKFDDGGCAFPEIEYGSSGMTLRDYFASKAITIPDTGAWNYTLASKDQVASRIASFAYMIADAMIAERKEQI